MTLDELVALLPDVNADDERIVDALMTRAHGLRSRRLVSNATPPSTPPDVPAGARGPFDE